MLDSKVQDGDRVCYDAAPTSIWTDRLRGRRPELLETIAAGLQARRSDILDIAARETAITVEELAPEFARMTGTLRMFAEVLREGIWVRAAIDKQEKNPQDAIGPNHDVRRMLVPLGPVAVFGASNFPLAYGVCGGDTASALAAGCSVIVKEHPAHPKTGRLIFKIASGSADQITGPHDRGADRLITYIQHEDSSDLRIPRQIVQHPKVTAVGFTGSYRGGMAIVKLATERSNPIPVFAEMGSANPVNVTALAAKRRGRAIADQIADSILSRHGQQCTKPGLVFVEDLAKAGAELAARLAERFKGMPGRDMLAPWVRDAYLKRVDECAATPGVRVLARGTDREGPRGTAAVLLSTDHKEWALNPVLHDEIFGPAAILIDAPLPSLTAMRPSLVSSWYFEPEENQWISFEADLFGFASKCGRIVFNGVPTGVRVASGMVHGGPFPSTNRPDTTAVGPLAIERWCRPVCFQNCPQELLPPELRDVEQK